MNPRFEIGDVLPAYYADDFNGHGYRVFHSDFYNLVVVDVREHELHTMGGIDFVPEYTLYDPKTNQKHEIEYEAQILETIEPVGHALVDLKTRHARIIRREETSEPIKNT